VLGFQLLESWVVSVTPPIDSAAAWGHDAAFAHKETTHAYLQTLSW
jgi:hypothetical protein